ncbi:hypothetical protein ACFOOM_09435 [Streptomyces echinoruber]|uniref:Uncharacterized protein n=1 Tax=Streptomyces echinoruber TaxID=68898 RepID=A0A918RLM4_9ACTN|nr:hypothetical protein [Streptomyces echinoruber]GHA01981.1 hypothetical protein GCM10010389_46620 [Streptomyces echinoruber]
MTQISTENDHSPIRDDHPPIYEDLLRERGDVVVEAQLAAERTRHRAAELLTGWNATGQGHGRDGGTGAFAAGRPEWHGAPS